ncbi:MFS transporter [Ottowia sp.]|uniref:MFS transporter n=1 Tax=Ottowia sp. TaxID=1898956 RepID=UPI0039E3C36E
MAQLNIKPLAATHMACTAAMMAFVAVIGPVARAIHLAEWQVGAVLTVGGVLWMLLSRPWGSMGDRQGRRKALLAGTGGFILSYGAMCALLVLALHTPLPNWMVFVGLMLTRGAVGAFYAAVPAVGQALIADHLPADRRAKALATVGAANGMGLVVGPAMAAALTQFSLVAPLLAIGLLPLLAFVLLRRSLPTSAPDTRSERTQVRMTDARLRRALAAAFVAMVCVYVAQVNVGFFALDRLGLAPHDAIGTAGSALTAVGVALIGAQLAARFIPLAPQRLLRLGALVSAAGFGCMPFAGTPVELVAFYFLAAAGMGWIFPSFAAMAANAVQPREQGAAAGLVGAAQGMGVVAGPLVGTFLYQAGPGVPYAIACVLLGLVAAWPGAAEGAGAD